MFQSSCAFLGEQYVTSSLAGDISGGRDGGGRVTDDIVELPRSW